MNKPVKVRILDHEYLIRSEADTDEVSRVADFVNNKIKEINEKSEGLTEKKAAILAALTIAGEYFKIQKERDDLLSSIRQRSKELIYTIDSMVG